MPLQFSATNPETGESQDFNLQELVADMQRNGEVVQGISPDGQQLNLVDSKGSFTVSPQQYLQNIGWQVQDVRPENPDYSGVDSGHRAAITAIAGEDNKRAYLEAQLKRQGVQNPKIMGQGRDFYYFDQNSGQYKALTNNPSWDQSDLAELGMEIPRGVGAVAVGAAGAVGGPIGMAAGAAAGGAVGDVAGRATLGYFDPQAGDIMKQSMGRQALDVGLKSGLDAASVGVGHFLPNGIASTATKAFGAVGEAGGRLINKAAKLVDNPMGREVVGSMMPVVGDASVAGTIARLPSQAVKGLSKVPGAIGETPFMQKAFPETAQAMTDWSRRMYSKSQLPTNTTGKIANAAQMGADYVAGKKPSSTVTTEDVAGNIGEWIGGGKPYRKILNMAEEGGLPLNDARTFATNEGSNLWGNVGKKLGRGLQTVEDVGKGFEALGAGVAAPFIKAARYGGQIGGKGAAALKNVATVTDPLENRFLSRYGSEEYLNRNPWQKPKKPNTINSTYALEE